MSVRRFFVSFLCLAFICRVGDCNINFLLSESSPQSIAMQSAAAGSVVMKVLYLLQRSEDRPPNLFHGQQQTLTSTVIQWGVYLFTDVMLVYLAGLASAQLPLKQDHRKWLHKTGKQSLSQKATKAMKLKLTFFSFFVIRCLVEHSLVSVLGYMGDWNYYVEIGGRGYGKRPLNGGCNIMTIGIVKPSNDFSCLEK